MPQTVSANCGEDLPVYVVLGMHKSGTTMISDMLQSSGIEMVEGIVRGNYDDGNKMERESTRSLNKEILGDTDYESVSLVSRPAIETIAPNLHMRAEKIVATMNTAPWGFKDPRTILTFEFWDSHIARSRLIGIFRDPCEVFQHYMSKAGRKWISRHPMFLPRALRAWCIYNRQLLNIARSRQDMLLLSFTDFMIADLEKRRLELFVGRKLVDVRKPQMRRAKSVRDFDYQLARTFVRLAYNMDPDEIHSDLRMAAQTKSSGNIVDA